jgi:hypothetical protein
LFGEHDIAKDNHHSPERHLGGDSTPGSGWPFVQMPREASNDSGKPPEAFTGSEHHRAAEAVCARGAVSD